MTRKIPNDQGSGDRLDRGRGAKPPKLNNFHHLTVARKLKFNKIVTVFAILTPYKWANLIIMHWIMAYKVYMSNCQCREQEMWQTYYQSETNKHVKMAGNNVVPRGFLILHLMSQSVIMIRWSADLLQSILDGVKCLVNDVFADVMRSLAIRWHLQWRHLTTHHSTAAQLAMMTMTTMIHIFLSQYKGRKFRRGTTTTTCN